MTKTRVVVVDDSQFSVGMISNILSEKGYEVVGSAHSLDSALETIRRESPDIVTMDMTMPGADGIECTLAIHREAPDVKVIIVSAMMDDEIVRKAKKAKVSGYIQKPVDGDELALLIERIRASEELFVELDQVYYAVFKESLKETCRKFFQEVPNFRLELKVNDEKVSRGVSAVLGIIGRYGGRMLLDLSEDTARRLAFHILRKEELDHEQVVDAIAEIANIVAGNACSLLNQANPIYGFRVAPPTVVYGESIRISKAELNTVSNGVAETSFGDLYMSVGFSRSEGA